MTVPIEERRIASERLLIRLLQDRLSGPCAAMMVTVMFDFEEA
jgi:hypothetical protein